MMRLRAFAVAILLASSAEAEVVRKTVVLSPGDILTHTVSGSITTINNTTPEESKVVRTAFQQYANTITIGALRTGEAKLQVEFTTTQIGEVLHVVVVDKATAAAFKFASTSVGGSEGAGTDRVHAGGRTVVVTGETWSVDETQRCAGIESRSSAGTTSVCAARPGSAVAAVAKESAWLPRASATFGESWDNSPRTDIAGLEGPSRWTSQIRLGDIPFVSFESASRASLIDRTARAVALLNRVAAEWKSSADSGKVYPATFRVRRSDKGYALIAQWKFDQGRRGETILELAPEELQRSAGATGGDIERFMKWSAALLYDTFRLYFQAASPLKTIDVLSPLYASALRLNGGPLDRAAAPNALARAFTSLRWSAGDPSTALLTHIPESFRGEELVP